jgi:molybdate transport system substrate-binding protein
MGSMTRIAPALLLLAAALAQAADIKVVASVGMKAVLDEARPLFEYSTGHKLVFVLGTAAPLKRRIEGGESFDVAILTPSLVEDLARQGKVVPESAIDVAKSGLGLAVAKGAARPGIATPEALKRALLGARAIARSKEGQSGTAAVAVIEKLGVTGELAPKILVETRVGGPLSAVQEGKADLAFALTSEIVPSGEVDFLGPVPAELQSYVTFTAGISPSSDKAEAAKAFVLFLRGASVAPILRSKGME